MDEPKPKPSLGKRLMLVLRAGGAVNGLLVYLKLLGLWPAVVAAFLSGFAFFSGVLEQMPSLQIAATVLSVFIATLAFVVSIKIYRDMRRFTELAQPGQEFWDDAHEFMIFQAAALWEGLNPYDPEANENPRVAAARAMLKNAIGSGRIAASDNETRNAVRPGPNGSEIHARTFVSRAELKKLAESRGDRPRFLFPPEKE